MGTQKHQKAVIWNGLNSLTDAIYSMDFISGYCYTQLTDVEQEQNGHMDMNRRDKVDAEKIRTIIQGGRK